MVERGPNPLHPETGPTPPPFDAIIVLGGGVIEQPYQYTDESGNIVDSTKIVPDYHAQIRVLAAAELVRQGRAGHVIFTGKGNRPDLGTEGDVMHRFFFNDAGDIPEGTETITTVETEAEETTDNFRRLKDQIEANGWKHIGVVTNDFHVERAVIDAQNVGIKGAVPVSAERILEEADPRYIEIFRDYYASPEIQKKLKSEKLLRMIQKVDKQGIFRRIITRFTR